MKNNTLPMKLLQSWIALCIAGFSIAGHAQIDHGVWNGLLQAHVHEFDGGRQTAVDYRGLHANGEILQAYLDRLATVSGQAFESWPVDSQLAFLINAYNAWTIKLILTEYPDIDSIRDIGFLPGAAWRRDIVSLFGSQVSLDELEHEMIRAWPQFQEPRIHFAVNCAARSCPPLRAEAYTAEQLDMQLEDNTRLFLEDRTRNYLEGETLFVSRIFDWYAEDFGQGWLGVNSTAEFLARYADALSLNNDQVDALLTGEIRIRYVRYDWGLNDLRSQK